MVKILVANKNIKTDFNNLDFLIGNKNFEIETSCTGLETIEKYIHSKPNILILDSNITDMSYTDVIDRISMFPGEDDNCNMILTLKNKEDKLILKNTSKIYKILDSPPYTDKVESTINILKNKFEKHKLSVAEIKYLFSKLGLPIYSEGSIFMISAIFKRYYSPEKYNKLDDILLSIANEYNISQDKVRNRLRTFLYNFNSSKKNDNIYYSKIFGLENNITPKSFVDDIVFYFSRIKK